MNTQLDNKDHRILRDLLRLAHDVPAANKARMAAAVAVRGEVLAWGTNEMRSHPFQAKYAKKVEAVFWHAETKAIHNFLRRNNMDLLKRATLYVARIKRPFERSKEFVPGMARPCKGCFSCITQFGVPRLVYTTESEGFQCEVAEKV